MAKTKEYFPESTSKQTMDTLYLTHLDLLFFLSNCGVSVAQHDLGDIYRKGLKVQQDYTLAVYWYRKAAEQGLKEAQNNLGYMYNMGYGVKRDYEEAIYLYRQAAEQGLKEAQNNLGVMYADGKGVKQDRTKAVYWYKKAAKQGLKETIDCLKRYYNITI